MLEADSAPLPAGEVMQAEGQLVYFDLDDAFKVTGRPMPARRPAASNGTVPEYVPPPTSDMGAGPQPRMASRHRALMRSARPVGAEFLCVAVDFG